MGCTRTIRSCHFLAEIIKIGKVETRLKRRSINEIFGPGIKTWFKIKTLHWIVRSEQKYSMKPYITLNTRLRTAAENKFEKEFFKLMNNGVFGKTMENIRNHKDTELVTSQEKYGTYVMKPNFKDGYPFSKELFTVEI